ncbi:MAG: DUF4149 domain-containing protein [Gammaproteobacteria bacterium]|nr:DUF4149 domain-containing protein [Gammaproteobacteria bacterium]
MFSGLSGERVLLTLWVGSVLSIGYLAVPIAFATLGDITLAGNYAGKLFSTVNLLGMGCGSVLLLGKVFAKGKRALTLWRFWVVVLMLVLTLVFYFYLQPQMADIKKLAWETNAELTAQFSVLHSIGRNLYLLLTILGLALVVTTDNFSLKTGA